MTYRIEVVTLQPQPVLVIEEEVAPDAIGEVLARILPAVHGAASELDTEISGMPFMRYLEMGEKFLIQAGVPVSERVEGTHEIGAAELPGGRAATTVFYGPYHEVGAAWDAIDAWREERGIKPASGGWDIYENDPTEVSDPGELRTRLYQPLA
jgi:effector-binding domain-containing protein